MYIKLTPDFRNFLLLCSGLRFLLPRVPRHRFLLGSDYMPQIIFTETFFDLVVLIKVSVEARREAVCFRSGRPANFWGSTQAAWWGYSVCLSIYLTASFFNVTVMPTKSQNSTILGQWGSIKDELLQAGIFFLIQLFV